MALKTGQKTGGADSLYSRMTSIKKSGAKGDKQKNGEDTYRLEGWDDNPEIESGTEQKQKFQKQKEHDIMMQQEARRKKLGISKWDNKRKNNK